MTTLLELDAIDVAYGDFQAPCGITLQVERGRDARRIGANGAGKSTLLKRSPACCPPDRRSVPLRRQAVAALRPIGGSRDGISLVPEGRRIFPSLTVQENLLVGAHEPAGPWNLRPSTSVPAARGARRGPAARSPVASSRPPPSGGR